MKLKVVLGMALPLLFVTGCSEIFEKNLEKATVSLIAPADELETDVQTLQFWWAEVEGADEYQLQIATPTFAEPNELVLDTTISAEIWTVTLTPGRSYEWRVKALNSAYESDWSSRTLSVDSTSSLVDQQVLLTAPLDGYATQDTVLLFEWEALAAATEYEWEAYDATGVNIAGPWTVTADTATFEVPEGTRSWSVRAIADQTSTLPSYFDIYVDRTAPIAPTLLAPANNDSTTIGTAIAFSWNHESPTNAPISDSLEVYPDSVNFNAAEAAFTNAGAHSVDSLDAGDWFWRVKSVDAAGNSSDWSALRKLIVE